MNDGTMMHLTWYAGAELEELDLASPDDVAPYLERPGVTWLHVQGLGDVEAVHRVGELFQVHPLAVEDVIVTAPERPKAEEFENHDFIIVHHVQEAPDHQLTFVQFSLFVGPNYVLSLQNGATDFSESVRQRIRASRGAVRHEGVDYLMYTLLDTVVDGYFPVLESFGEYLEFIQDETLLRNLPETLPAIQRAKRQLLALRRHVWPQREVLNTLLRDDNDTVTQPVQHYLRDCYDHVVMLIDTVETYREMASDLMDAYMSAVSNRLNSVMKVLTVIATVFMPLTFLVGVYGMNFHTGASPWNMPELRWAYGYPACWAVMVLTVIAMLMYFRRVGWIGGTDVPCVGEDQRPPRCDLWARLRAHGRRRDQ